MHARPRPCPCMPAPTWPCMHVGLRKMELEMQIDLGGPPRPKRDDRPPSLKFGIRPLLQICHAATFNVKAPSKDSVHAGAKTAKPSQACKIKRHSLLGWGHPGQRTSGESYLLYLSRRPSHRPPSIVIVWHRFRMELLTGTATHPSTIFHGVGLGPEAP